MPFGTRWPFRALWRIPPSGGPASERSSPASHPLRARLPLAVLLLLTTWLAFLIHYPYPLFPYLIMAVLAASLWRLRAGIISLLAALALLALTIYHASGRPGRDGWDDMLGAHPAGTGVSGSAGGVGRARATAAPGTAAHRRALRGSGPTPGERAAAGARRASPGRAPSSLAHHVGHGGQRHLPGRRSGRIRFANERLGKLLGLDPRAVIGREADEAVLKPLGDRCRGGIATLPLPPRENPPEGARQLIELLHPIPRLLYQDRARCTDGAGGELGCLYVYSDSPYWDRLQELLEARVNERTRELEAAHEQLLRSTRLAALGQFSATMARRAA